MKIAKACRECRLAKRKCVQEDAGGCVPCKRRGLSCSSKDPRRDVQGRPILPTRAEPPAGVNISHEDVVEVVKIYLRYIHNCPHTLFHDPTLLRQVEEKTLPHKVLYGILGLGARFSSNPDIRSQADQFASLCRTELNREIDDISLMSIQACVLLGNILGAEGAVDVEFLYFGIALRMYQILRLDEPITSGDIIEQEIRLRIRWSLYMIDRWSAAGTNINFTIAEDDRCPLPMDELQFKSLTGLESEASISISRPGLWGRMIHLARIFYQIQDLHRQHVNHDINDYETEQRTHTLAAILDSFVEELPPQIRLTEDNAEWHAKHGLGHCWVALHLGYHHYSTLLFFNYLDLQLERTPAHLLFANRCKYHAAAFSDLLGLSMRIPGCEAMYFIVAHMAVVSSAAILHNLLFGPQDELQETRDRLKFNFEMIVRLQTYWPAVKQLMERLFVFQRACMWMDDPNTHKVDKWMVNFLMHHALPVPEKFEVGREGTSIRTSYVYDAMSILRR